MGKICVGQLAMERDFLTLLQGHCVLLKPSCLTQYTSETEKKTL